MATQGRNFLKGMAFLSPWLIGFVVFLVLPIVLSLYYSTCDFSLLQPPVSIGGENFRALVHDAVFWKVLKNTLLYAAMALPASLLVSLAFALLLNVSIPGQSIFRTIIFLPSLAPAAAGAMVWMFLLNAKLGMVNHLLANIGIGAVGLLVLAFLCASGLVIATFINHQKPSPKVLLTWLIIAGLLLTEVVLEFSGAAWSLVQWSVDGPGWLIDTQWVLKTFVLISLWGVGNTVVIYLAGLQDVPRELYESAEIDGASTLRRLWHVTLPMLSPVIFFNLIMGIIGTLQNFTGPQLITGGGPDNASKFYSMYLYDFAFTFLRMGYASAMAWIQLLLVMALTGIAFWSSKRWVHYQGK